MIGRRSQGTRTFLLAGLIALVALILVAPATPLLQALSASQRGDASPMTSPDAGSAPTAPSTGSGSSWSGVVAAAVEAEDRDPSLQPAFSLGGNFWATILAAAVGTAIILGCVVGDVFTAGLATAAAIGCLLLAFVVGAAIFATYELIAGEAPPPSEVEATYANAVLAAQTLLGGYESTVTATAGDIVNSAENIIGAESNFLGTEASRAIYGQLPYSTFSAAEDLVASGIATQLTSVLDGDALDLLDNLAGWVDYDWLYDFGIAGAYSQYGIVCEVEPTTTVDMSNYTLSYVAGPVPDTTGGTYGSDGQCLEGVSAEPQSTNLSLSVNGSAGVTIPAHGGYIGGGLPIYIGPSATITPIITQAGECEGGDCQARVELNLTGPWPSDNVTHVYIASESPATVLGLTPGLWNLTGVSDCGTDASPLLTYCGNAELKDIDDDHAVTLIGAGLLPLPTAAQSAYESQVGIAAGANSNGTSGLYQGVYFDCAPGVGSSVLEPLTTESGYLTDQNMCPDDLGSAVTDDYTEAAGDSDIGEAYWSFLHDLGVYTVSTIPANCTIPVPADFLPADTPLSEIVSFGPQDIENFLLSYVTALYYDYAGDTGTVQEANFCGLHIPPPGNVTLNDPNWALIGDLFTHTGDQELSDLSTWFVVDQGLIVLPDDGNLTIPVGKTWEAPAANPSTVYYGPTTPTPADIDSSNVADATIDLGLGGALPSFLGNSTLSNGSVYPADTQANLGAGSAIHLTQCWSNESGEWEEVSVCYRNVTTVSYVVPNGSLGCYFTYDGACLQNGSSHNLEPTPVFSCGFSLATDFALPFEHVTIFGIGIGALACVIGWILLAIVVGVVLFVAIAVVRGIAERGD